MTYHAIFHAEVKTDYDEAYVWYESQEEGLGEKFLAAVRNKIEEIVISPETYGERTEKGYREAVVDGFPFSIIYTVYKKKKEIFISSIHHHKKNPKKKYRKTK
ncbi:MAG: type II toxin-antitoxin system RelE/ParE family toxin [Chitinophagaceae bacterium]|nr:type II toxin-antitoxin system RelE/ParE family toxin [Chitinophagaceae bacterium]